jgi:mono/diheme cytochrome c family protein
MRAGALGLAAAAATLSLSGLAVAAAGGGPAVQGQALFKQDCASCHTIGGGFTLGPDLKGIVASAGEGNVRNFVTDPGKVIASGDPKIAALMRRAHGVKMPNLGLTPAQVNELLAYLEAQGGGSTPPATTTARAAGDPSTGKNLFTGATQFAHGGPACISCHTLAGIGSLGGGQIGPDLSHAGLKYGGAKGLTPVLTQIPFPKMIPLYSGHPLTSSEAADVAAYLAAPKPAARTTDQTWKLVALGGTVTLGALALMLVVWPRRRLVVRKRIAPTNTFRRA